MNITDKLLTKGEEHGRTGNKLVPQGICVHYVGNPKSTAIANRNWFENGAGGAYTSSHYIIGLDGEILRLVPDNEQARHAGKSYGAQWNETAKKNNQTLLGIECCHPDTTGEFNEKTRASLVWLCADLMKKHGLGLATVVRHYDVTGKSCPMFYVNRPDEWRRLTADIGGAREALDGSVFDGLYSRGIILSPDYWNQNAKDGGQCRGDYVKMLVTNLVAYYEK